ncbi:MAG: dihydrofolate reductase family protein [Bacteroidota bacterium]
MLPPLEILHESTTGSDLPLPPELAAFYDRLSFPTHGNRPYIISNFVSTLDGAVSLDAAGMATPGDLNGPGQQDVIVMGMLRAVADVVIIGAGSLRSSPQHTGTAAQVFPPFMDVYKSLRERMGKQGPHLNVVVTATGNVDLSFPVFQSDKIPALIVTTKSGSERIRAMDIPGSVQVIAGTTTGSLTAQDILKAVARIRPLCELILVEGGPRLMGDLFAGGCIDELFLTLAPQVAGRKNFSERPGFVAGRIFAPEYPLWGSLVSVKRGDSHLFLRYAFQSVDVL